MTTTTAVPSAEPCSCVGRRGFLTGAAALALTAATGGWTALGELTSARVAFAEPGYTGDVLVVVSLRGGLDGLQAVVPVGDPAYALARPTIAIPAARAVQLDPMFGLHPSLSDLLPYWQAGTFGAVHAVGQAAPTRSHFEAMDEMERAAPGSSLRSGWIDRTIGSSSGTTPFAATKVGNPLAGTAFMGPSPELTMQSVNAFRVNAAGTPTERAKWRSVLQALHAEAPELVRAPAQNALGVLETLSTLQDTGYTPAAGVTYPTGNSLATALQDVARLVKADVGLRAVAVDYGDWDMHVGQGTVDSGWMARHLKELGSALAAFAADLGELLGRVTLVTLSEFGRRVGENGSGGSDHGHGNCVLMLGGGVVGGKVHGRWPGLAPADLIDGDLVGTTDYRAILAEVLEKRCGVPAGSVFPGLSSERPGVAIPKS
ncbi:DUF1501 domain-containing protein [Motilibacter aurantiacus]|uniref:DUF1501 domain-containing protein n=1 Tax=Motilibacter aurantiacus TaxID=2714955 RepID=UPI00140BB443|nr:DUF1501 domain-containing protein [Motilibacter aurantiacus]NHC45021.1 DUF1501 domain-containing protein [Motilibacter aurantiacus]